MKNNHMKLMAAGMLVLALMTGCSANENDINGGPDSNISAEIEDAGYHEGEQEGPTDTETGQSGESSPSQGNTGTEQSGENSPSRRNTGTGQSGESSPSHRNTETEQMEGAQSQSGTTAAEGDIEKELAAYRAEREKGVSTFGSYAMVEVPNGKNYHYGVGDSSYTSRFDSRELNKAFEAAGVYVKNTLNMESEVWPCVDPRMTAIYEDEDKGVARGYDADDIFLCEYNDNGNWQYLILVREGKGADWEALYYGGSYKTD